MKENELLEKVATFRRKTKSERDTALTEARSSGDAVTVEIIERIERIDAKENAKQQAALESARAATPPTAPASTPPTNQVTPPIKPESTRKKKTRKLQGSVGR